jgi:putative N6-adenine-specific DNA methylase
MNTYTIIASCHFGLESVLKFEITKLGGTDLVVTDGKIAFKGDKNIIARANICLSTAERVMIELGHFKALSFEELFQGVKKLPLEEFISEHDRFPVTGSSINSKLYSIPDCQSIIKKAAVTRLSDYYKTSWFTEDGPDVQIRFSILKDMVSVCLDTSGVGLHKRGYRYHSNTAPIKETLAAGIVDLARVRSDSVVCDPFCGSGTLLIESAFKALNIAPGLRRRFQAEKWSCFEKTIWDEERTRAMDLINKSAKFEAYGFDIDPECVALVVENSRKAGVNTRITVKERDISDFELPTDSCIIMCNPPYGERLLDVERARVLYKVMGKAFPSNRECPSYVISPDDEFEQCFGKKADKKRKLYNGMMKCNLFQYFK